MLYSDLGSSGGLRRLPLGETRFRATDNSQGRESTPERGLKNEAPARAYSTGTHLSFPPKAEELP